MLIATVAAFALMCQSSLASTRAPIAAAGAPIAAAGAPAATSSTSAAASSTSAAASTPTFSLAPLSPAYTRYLRLRGLSRSRLSLGEHGLGYVPSPIDFSYLGRTGASSAALGAYPASFDLRTLGRLSAIEDQGQTGCCWTFATMGSLESGLLPSDPESFSEDNLALNSGYDSALAGAYSAYNSGGNALMSTAYLVRWAGPVLASQDAFDDSYTPPGLSAAKHVQDVLYLPARTSSSDNSAIKAAVMTYGAVYTSMYADQDGMCSDADSQYYNAGNASYYCDGAAGQQDHAVDIVGWNDNYAASNFSSDNGVTDQPPGNGAFIVRNSWSTGWGDAGYFYVSYYDTNFAYDVNAAFDDAESASNFNEIYQYDPLGWTDGVGFGDGATATEWGANVFTATASDELDAVSFYAAEPGTGYTVYAGASLSSLTARGSGTLEMGYHTVDLSSPLPLTSGQPFAVAVELTTPGYGYPVPVEYPASGASAATASPGESYVSGNGSQWTDLTSVNGCDQANVCLKAFTKPTGADVTAPTTTVIPVNNYEVGYWNNAPCDFHFTAADNTGGSGVDTTQYDLDGQGWTLWSPGAVFTVPAPADHTNDGQHNFLVRSTDVAGNPETPQSFSVAIDTRRPSSKAPYAAHVRRGSYATLKFEVLDTGPCYGKCLAVITVKTLKGAHKLTLSPTTWYKCGSKVVSYRFKCKLARGKYRFYVTTWDGATNRSSKTSVNYLTVT